MPSHRSTQSSWKHGSPETNLPGWGVRPSGGPQLPKTDSSVQTMEGAIEKESLAMEADQDRDLESTMGARLREDDAELSTWPDDGTWMSM